MTEFNFASMIPIEKGWSGDKKYFVTKENGERFLLRISPIERFEDRKKLYSILKKVAELKISMCEAVEFGICDKGVYTLHTLVHPLDVQF